MVAGFEIKGRRFSPAPDLGIVLFVPAIGHRFVRQVRYSHQDIVQFFLQRSQFFLVGLELFAQPFHLGQQGRDILACRLGLADRLRSRIAFRLQFLGACLQ